MKTTLWVAYVFVLASCSQEETIDTGYAPLSKADSAILHSQRLHHTTELILDKADSVTELVVEEAAKNVDNLERLNNILSRENGTLKRSKSMVIVHDTIVITEKKNFWGKTKTFKDTLEANLSSVIIDTTNQK